MKEKDKIKLLGIFLVIMIIISLPNIIELFIPSPSIDDSDWIDTTNMTGLCGIATNIWEHGIPWNGSGNISLITGSRVFGVSEKGIPYNGTWSGNITVVGNRFTSFPDERDGIPYNEYGNWLVEWKE